MGFFIFRFAFKFVTALATTAGMALRSTSSLSSATLARARSEVAAPKSAGQTGGVRYWKSRTYGEDIDRALEKERRVVHSTHVDVLENGFVGIEGVEFAGICGLPSGFSAVTG